MNNEEQRQNEAIARAFESTAVRDELKSVADMMTDPEAAPFGAVHLLAGQVAARVIQLRVVQDMAREDRERAAKRARESIEASVDAALDDVGSWLMWMHGFHAARFREDRFVLGGDDGASLSLCSEMLLEVTTTMVGHFALGAVGMEYAAAVEISVSVAWARIAHRVTDDQERCVRALRSAAEHAPLSLRQRFASVADALETRIKRAIDRSRRTAYAVCATDCASFDCSEDDPTVFVSSVEKAAEHAIEAGLSPNDVAIERWVEVVPTIDRDVGDMITDAVQAEWEDPDHFDAMALVERHFSPELSAIRAKVETWNERAPKLAWWVAGGKTLSDDEVREAFDEARKRASADGVVSGEEKSG